MFYSSYFTSLTSSSIRIHFKKKSFFFSKFIHIIDHIAGSLPHSLAINPLNSDECQSSLGSFNPNSAVCGRAQGNPCDVDNGSALACTRGNGRYLLKGIFSTESGCGPNQVMKFTKMDVDFIKNGSSQKSLPINPSVRSGEFTSPSSSSRGLKKYLPPQDQV